MRNEDDKGYRPDQYKKARSARKRENDRKSAKKRKEREKARRRERDKQEMESCVRKRGVQVREGRRHAGGIARNRQQPVALCERN